MEEDVRQLQQHSHTASSREAAAVAAMTALRCAGASAAEAASGSAHQAPSLQQLDGPAAPRAPACTNLRLGLLNPALSHVAGGGERNALSAPCTVTAAYTPSGGAAPPVLPAGAFTQGSPVQAEAADGLLMLQQLEGQAMHTPFTNLAHQQQQLQDMCLPQYGAWDVGAAQQPPQFAAAGGAHLGLAAYGSMHSSGAAHHFPPPSQPPQVVGSPTCGATATGVASGGFSSPSCLGGPGTPTAWGTPTSARQQAQSALRPSCAATLGAEHSARSGSWSAAAQQQQAAQLAQLRQQHWLASGQAGGEPELTCLVGSSGGAEVAGAGACAGGGMMCLDGSGEQAAHPSAAGCAAPAAAAAAAWCAGRVPSAAGTDAGGSSSCAGAPPSGRACGQMRVSEGDDGVLGRVWDSFDGSTLTAGAGAAAACDGQLCDAVKLVPAAAALPHWGSSGPLDALAGGGW
jgi:hypothetical protein